MKTPVSSARSLLVRKDAKSAKKSFLLLLFCVLRGLLHLRIDDLNMAPREQSA